MCDLQNRPTEQQNHRLVLLTHDRGHQEGVGKPALLEEQARVGAQEREARQLLRADRQRRAECPPEVGAPEAVKVRAQDPAEALGVRLV